MKMDLYTYILEDKWKKPGSDIKYEKEYLGCEYNFPETIVGRDFDRPKSQEEKDGMIVLSFAPPEWRNVKRFARLILTKEEAKKLKKELSFPLF
jgi:hypothetical protein